MRRFAVIFWLTACGAPAAAPSAPLAAPSAPLAAWPVPAGFRGETIPFPLDFAPGLAHKGVEELRFAPGFFDPSAPGYWSYAFVWRTDDAAAMDAASLGGELTVYFRGLIAAVDDKHEIADRDAIAVRATPSGARLALAAHVYDAFRTKQPLDLAGWAQRTACGSGALWRFVLAPAGSAVRASLDEAAAGAARGQPVPPPPPPR